MSKVIFVTGGAGFIGSALVRYILQHTDHSVVNIDKLTYAANLASLAEVSANPRYHFAQVDICDKAALDALFSQYQPAAVMHLAAESHVDRSINGPAAFIHTNIVGTYTLLEASRHYYSQLKNGDFVFQHISTDEVFGDLHGSSALFTEHTSYAPSSPYAASKASADHLVRAWHRTYGLPVLISNCSNNYGPWQYPDKLIPLTISNALAGKALPIYGDGKQIRDWLYVDDHARALWLIYSKGRIGDTYNIGGHNEVHNIDVVKAICSLLDQLAPIHNSTLNTKNSTLNTQHSTLITHVKDRPGHDQRYAIDASKIQHELGWVPTETFSSGLNKTVQWYLQRLHNAPVHALRK